MNKVLIFFAILLLAGVIGTACKSSKSEKTGWTLNDKYYGFQVNNKFEVGPGPGLISIEGGTFVMGGSSREDLTYENDNVKRRVTVASFYMDETEVANVDWREYLYWIKRSFPNDQELYYNAMPDTLVWRRPLSYNEPYVNNYFRHPAFQDYPVVGISWEQAVAYCDWRTDRVNEEILRDKGALISLKQMAGGTTGGGTTTTTNVPVTTDPFNTDIYLNGQYRGEGIDGKKMPRDLDPKAVGAPTETNTSSKPVRPVRMEDGILKQPYRLPTEAEWEYAAMSLIGNTQYENIEDGKVYPWNGLGVRSPRKKTQGMILANFKRGRGDNMGTGGYLNDKADITAPVRSYVANDFGLYNMAGNVNEWTADVYRKLSYEDFEDFNPFRGNQYVDKQLADPSKGTYSKDKYGKPVMVPAPSARKQTWEELNNTRPDSTSQVAGDAPSSKPYTPDYRGHLDTVNVNLYGTTTLVNNRSRVYKGGSWNDMAYWLNPASRRFMQQDESSAELGFRSAMTLVGDPEISSRNKPQFKAKKTKAK